MRAIWATRDMARVSALNLSPHYLAMANLDEWLDGQKTFQTGERAKWTLR
jgi:hypothetical protein